ALKISCAGICWIITRIGLEDCYFIKVTSLFTEIKSEHCPKKPQRPTNGKVKSRESFKHRRKKRNFL
uniref:Ovule protein n=1 Tax=Ascaris lumbricoides TaxID=6252 RepID=A0A0M3HFM6_ASCLU